MFVYYFVHVHEPFEQVEPALLRMLPGLRGWAEEAYRDGERLRAKIGPGDHQHRMVKSVLIVVGEPLRGSGETWIPLVWEARGASGLFPRMEGDICVGGMGSDLTQLTFRGSYRVPMGAVGRALDRLILHRIAEASVKGFVDRIARALSTDAKPSSASVANHSVVSATRDPTPPSEGRD
jgi:hypothetical protein